MSCSFITIASRSQTTSQSPRPRQPRNRLCRRGDQRGTTTRIDTLVVGTITRDVDTARAGESRDDFFFRAGVYAQKPGQKFAFFLGHHRAFTGQSRTVNDGLGKAQAARVATGAAVCSGQHLLCCLNAGVLVDMQYPVSQHQQGGEHKAQRSQRQYAYQHVKTSNSSF